MRDAEPPITDHDQLLIRDMAERRQKTSLRLITRRGRGGIGRMLRVGFAAAAALRLEPHSSAGRRHVALQFLVSLLVPGLAFHGCADAGLIGRVAALPLTFCSLLGSSSRLGYPSGERRVWAAALGSRDQHFLSAEPWLADAAFGVTVFAS